MSDHGIHAGLKISLSDTSRTYNVELNAPVAQTMDELRALLHEGVNRAIDHVVKRSVNDPEIAGFLLRNLSFIATEEDQTNDPS